MDAGNKLYFGDNLDILRNVERYSVDLMDEQAYGYNYRQEMKDFDRFSLALKTIVGRRLTYYELGGKLHDTSEVV